jgi:disulfide bond formation protein DsbB
MKKPAPYFLLTLFICITCICFAFFVEKFLGKKPCNLCLVERWFLYGFVGVFLLHFYHLRFANILSLLNFTGGMGVSFYHILLEKGVIVAACKFNLEMLKSQISCGVVGFRLFGFSLTIWVFALYLLLFVCFLAKSNKSLFK